MGLEKNAFEIRVRRDPENYAAVACYVRTLAEITPKQLLF